MKNICQKFHLNFSTYIFFLLSFFCGFFKQTILIFVIIFFHECGHILMIHLCHYKFIKVEFYPFGGITKIDKPINSSVNKEILIASSGIFVQLVLALLLFVMKQHHINFDGIDFMGKMNWTILIFNCLPIIPLDGSVIFHSFLEKIFSFEKSFTFYEVISCFCLILFTIINYTLHLDNYYICFVLATEYILLKKEKKYLLHRFYLERLLK